MTLESPSHIFIRDPVRSGCLVYTLDGHMWPQHSICNMWGPFKEQRQHFLPLLVISYPKPLPSQALQQNVSSWVACPWTTSAHFALLGNGPNSPTVKSLSGFWRASSPRLAHSEQGIKNSFRSCKFRIYSFLGPVCLLWDSGARSKSYACSVPAKTLPFTEIPASNSQGSLYFKVSGIWI